MSAVAAVPRAFSYGISGKVSINFAARPVDGPLALVLARIARTSYYLEASDARSVGRRYRPLSQREPARRRSVSHASPRFRTYRTAPRFQAGSRAARSGDSLFSVLICSSLSVRRISESGKGRAACQPPPSARAPTFINRIARSVASAISSCARSDASSRLIGPFGMATADSIPCSRVR